MQSRNRKLNQILVVTLLVLVAISVGYAALSTTLTIQGNTVSQTVQTFNIGFTGNSSTAIIGGGDEGRACSNATVSSTTVTVNSISLSKPGDYCKYALTIKNNGSIAGKIGSITPNIDGSTSCTKTSATETASAKMVCGNITYELSGDEEGTTAFPKDTVLTSGQTKQVYLIAIFTGANPATGNVTHTNPRFSIVYNQN